MHSHCKKRIEQKINSLIHATSLEGTYIWVPIYTHVVYHATLIKTLKFSALPSHPPPFSFSLLLHQQVFLLFFDQPI